MIGQHAALLGRVVVRLAGAALVNGGLARLADVVVIDVERVVEGLVLGGCECGQCHLFLAGLAAA
jgi:hypothetical protein